MVSIAGNIAAVLWPCEVSGQKQAVKCHTIFKNATPRCSCQIWNLARYRVTVRIAKLDRGMNDVASKYSRLPSAIRSNNHGCRTVPRRILDTDLIADGKAAIH